MPTFSYSSCSHISQLIQAVIQSPRTQSPIWSERVVAPEAERLCFPAGGDHRMSVSGQNFTYRIRCKNNLVVTYCAIATGRGTFGTQEHFPGCAKHGRATSAHGAEQVSRSYTKDCRKRGVKHIIEFLCVGVISTMRRTAGLQ